MPRWNKKADKIVIDLIGQPENMSGEVPKKQRKIKRQLTNEEGQWAK